MNKGDMNWELPEGKSTEIREELERSGFERVSVAYRHIPEGSYHKNLDYYLLDNKMGTLIRNTDGNIALIFAVVPFDNRYNGRLDLYVKRIPISPETQ